MSFEQFDPEAPKTCFIPGFVLWQEDHLGRPKKSSLILDLAYPKNTIINSEFPWGPQARGSVWSREGASITFPVPKGFAYRGGCYVYRMEKVTTIKKTN